MNRLQFGALAAVLLAFWGALEYYQLESVWNNEFRDPYLIAAQHARFEGAKQMIPPDAIVGYITDLEPNSVSWSAAFNGAQYVLAPRLLEPGTTRQWLIANFARPADFLAFAKSTGFHIEKDFGNGVVVMKK